MSSAKGGQPPAPIPGSGDDTLASGDACEASAGSTATGPTLRVETEAYGAKVLAGAHGGLGGSTGAPDLAPPSEEVSVTPESTGRYLDTRGAGAEIGRGGIGRVLAVFDRHLGREVALKELLPGLEPSATAPRSAARTPIGKRFLREARVTGQLEHPNIVPVYEVGERDDGTLYYAMKLVRGETLAARLARCKGLGERLQLLPNYIGVCQAIAYAHNRGVIHRDIKTANVMVGEFGETVVLDWGLAKVRGSDDLQGGSMVRRIERLSEEDLLRTRDGALIGTPAYMSPEQALGRVDEIDERSDVWSLGAVLYEVLTGRPPYTGGSFVEFVQRLTSRPVPDARAGDPRVPVELAAICRKALSRDKAERYRTARQLADEVQAFQSGLLVGAHEYSTWELVRRFAARHSAALVAAAVVLLTLVAALGLVTRMYRREVRASRAAAALRRAGSRRRARRLSHAAEAVSATRSRSRGQSGRPTMSGPTLSIRHSVTSGKSME